MTRRRFVRGAIERRHGCIIVSIEQPGNNSSFAHSDLFADIQREWNAAEESIKRSEQVALDVSIPAIFELRYAGRRIVDALDIAQRGGTAEKVQAVLEDARFCCHRARHDAIDAALAKIAIDLDDMTHRLGYAAVIGAYPDFHLLYIEFEQARTKIAESRGDRQNRNMIYSTVSNVDFPSIVERYKALVVCKPIALAYSAKRSRERLGWWVMLGITIIALILAVLAVDWPKVGSYWSQDEHRAPKVA